MELMIYSPTENERLPEIQWNFEEIKKYAAEKAAWYLHCLHRCRYQGNEE